MRMQWIPGLPSPSPLRRPGDEANVLHHRLCGYDTACGTHQAAHGNGLHLMINNVLILDITMKIRRDQLNKLLHGFARSNFWANKTKRLINLGGAYVH